MIEKAIQEKLKSVCQDYWATRMKEEEFQGRVTGKESGHRIADWVEEKTAQLIEDTFRKDYASVSDGEKPIVGYQRDKKDNPVDRGIGDIWIHSKGMYNPVNIKTGIITDTQGQPNLVSLRKLLTAICERKIDSYYLLIIRFDLSEVRPVVHFVDLLDCLDYVHFDSGPGQIMLKQKDFYDAFGENGVIVNTIGLIEKIEKLLEMFKEGNIKLAENRKNTEEHLEKIVSQFDSSEQIKQEDLNVWFVAKLELGLS